MNSCHLFHRRDLWITQVDFKDRCSIKAQVDTSQVTLGHSHRSTKSGSIISIWQDHHQTIHSFPLVSHIASQEVVVSSAYYELTIMPTNPSTLPSPNPFKKPPSISLLIIRLNTYINQWKTKERVDPLVSNPLKNPLPFSPKPIMSIA